MNPLLVVEKCSVAFDGFKALDIDLFTVEANELRVVIGPNGAGKTTLLDVICGKTKPDTGKVYLGNDDLVTLREGQIVQKGVGRKFQTPTIFPSLNVYDNLLLAMKASRGVLANWFHIHKSSEKEKIQFVAEKIGLSNRFNTIAGSLSHGQKQWLEIGMVMMQEPQLMLIDEPAAGMTDEETEKTGVLLTELAKDRSIIVIEHDMVFVRQIAKTVTVLHQGKVLVEGPMEQVQSDSRVIECYLGSQRSVDD